MKVILEDLLIKQYACHAIKPALGGACDAISLNQTPNWSNLILKLHNRK